MRPPVAFRAVISSIVVAGSVGLAAMEFGCRAPGPRRECPVDAPDPPLREFRGIFVTTAYNLDWPSKPGLHWRVQADEIHAIVNRAKELNCNVIILQVRAFGDRIHRHTKLPTPEPWSAALNRQHDPDTTPKPQYDPLGEWIKACDAQGIELHAWVNPFRVDNLIETKEGNNARPTVLPVVATDDGQHLYLDPTSGRVQAYVLEVIRDLLEYRVAVDAGPVRRMAAMSSGGGNVGIAGMVFDHFPYAKPGGTGPVSLRLGDAGGGAAGEDRSGGASPPAGHGTAGSVSPRIRWLLKKAGRQRPEPNPPSIDTFIQRVFTEVYTKHGAKFGISPCYADADAKRWLNKGWVNYVIPELYFQKSAKPFRATLEEWLDPVPPPSDFPRIVVAGLFTVRVQSPEKRSNIPWSSSVIESQIGDSRAARSDVSKENAHGQAHYSWFALRSPEQGGPSDPSNNIGDRLKENLYAQPALVPQCTAPPAGVRPPGRPTVRWKSKGTDRTATWECADPNVFCWAVWLRENHRWGRMQVFGRSTAHLDVPATVDRVAVKAIDRYNRESEFGISP